MVWAPCARRRAGYSPVDVAATIPGLASTLSTSAAPKSTQTGAPSGSPQGPARAEPGKTSATSATTSALTGQGVARAADRVPPFHGSLTQRGPGSPGLAHFHSREIAMAPAAPD